MKHLEAFDLVTRHTAGQLTHGQQRVLIDALTRIPKSARDFELECGLIAPTFSADQEDADHV